MTKKTVLKDAFEYAQRDLAGRHTSDAGSQDTVPADVIDAHMATLERDGYIILPDLIDLETIARIKEDALPRFKFDSGRNNFEGFATQRLYAVIEKTFTCNSLVEHPVVLGLLDRLFAPNYLLSQLQIINILPGEAQQPLHADDGFYPWPRPRPPLGAATICAVDDFTEENGATVVIPGSHTWGDRLPTKEDEARMIPAVMPAGSVLFLLGTLWHAGGANTTSAARMCATAQYCAPWVRQQENSFLSVSKERVKQCSPHIQRMLGYSIHAPFVGFVDGMHPKRVLEER